MPPSLILRSISRIAFLLLLALPALADKFDVQDALNYLPSKAIGALGFIVYVTIGVMLLWRLVRNRDWWGLCLPIGAFAEASGFILRVFIVQPRFRGNFGVFIAMTLLILLSPAAFLAFNYILYGRLIRICVGREHSYIRPNRVGGLFVISDILTFLVQAAGGSMGGQSDTAKVGQYIFLAGIVLQAASYLIFMVLVAASQRSILRRKSLQARDPRGEIWYSIYKLLYFSSFFIMVRLIYRVVESATGFEGYLMTHEWPFLVFDSIPLAIAISIYIYHWPGNYLPKQSTMTNMDTQQLGIFPIHSGAEFR